MSKVSQNGFYWVKPRPDKGYPDDRWQPAELKDGKWWIIGDDGWWAQEDFEAIDPEPIVKEGR